MAGLFRNWGYEVLTAATQPVALGELAERGRPPDLIVCDCRAGRRASKL
jgi:CheY-like chemotaxis protein